MTEFQEPQLPADFITNKVCWPRNLPINFSITEILLWNLTWKSEAFVSSEIHDSSLVADAQKIILQTVDMISIYSVWKRKRLDHAEPLRHQTLTDHLLCDRACSQCSENNDEQTHRGLPPVCSKSGRKGTQYMQIPTEVCPSKQRYMGLWICNRRAYLVRGRSGKASWRRCYFR